MFAQNRGTVVHIKMAFEFVRSFFVGILQRLVTISSFLLKIRQDERQRDYGEDRRKTTGAAQEDRAQKHVASTAQTCTRSGVRALVLCFS